MKNLNLYIKLLTNLYYKNAPIIHETITTLTKKPTHNIKNTLNLNRKIAQYFKFKKQKNYHSKFN